MAVPDIQKIVKIVFAGDDTSLGKTINSVGGGMDALGVKLKGATQPLADFSDAVLKIDVVLAGIAAGALVVATTAAGTFGDSFREITTLIEAPAEAMDEFRTNVLNYSRDSGSSIEDVSGALYSIISATSDWENSLDALTATERLNIAGKGELADTSKLLSTALNAYGAAAADAGDYSDVLFTAVRVGVTTLPELSAGLGSITALANSAGVPFDDLAASVAALTGSTGDTSLSVTQLKGILTAILGPGKAARDMAESLEIAFDREALAAEGLQGFLQKVFAATGGNSEQMKVLFGRVEALTGALILGEDASGKFATAMQAMEERTGVVDKAYEKMADGFGLNNQRIINSLRVTLIDVGTPLLDEWGELAGGLANIFEGVSVGIDAGAFDPVINFIEGVAGDLSELFEGIGLALPDALADVDWSGFTDSLEGLLDIGKDILKDLFGDLDLKNAKDLGDAIQIVVNLLDRWMVLTGGIIDNLRPIIAVVGDMVAKFAEADKETVKIVGSIAAWGKTVNLVAGFVPNLTGPLTLLAAGFNLMALTRIPAMMSGLSGMLPALGGVGAALGVAAKGAVAFGLGWTIGTVLREHVPIIKEMGDNLGEAAFNLVHLGDNSVTAMERQAAHTKEMGDAAVAAALLSMKLKEITPGEAIEIDLALEDFFSDIDLATEYLQKELTPKQLVEIDFALDEFFKDIDTVQQKFEYIFTEDGQVIKIKVDPADAVQTAEDTKKKIDEKLPAQKLMEIQLQGDIDIQLETIKATAETLQTAFEWEAKVDIAELETQAATIIALSGDISEMFQNTGDVITSALGILATVSAGSPAYRVIEDALEADLKIRAELAAAEIKLTEQQILFIKARTDAVNKGKGLITINGEGLSAELAMVLEKIIQLAQIQANTEGFSALLGL